MFKISFSVATFSYFITTPAWSKDSLRWLLENSESSCCLEKFHRGLVKLVSQPRMTQLVELAAVVETFQLFQNEPFSIISDSLYVVGILNCIEHSFPKQVHNKNLFILFINHYILLSTLYGFVRG